MAKDVSELALVVVEAQGGGVEDAADVDDDVALGEDLRHAGADHLRVLEHLFRRPKKSQQNDATTSNGGALWTRSEGDARETG